MVSATSTWRRSSMAVTPAGRRACSMASHAVATRSSRFSMDDKASRKRSCHASNSARPRVREVMTSVRRPLFANSSTLRCVAALAAAGREE